MMRKVGAALLLLVLLMQVGGSYVYFGVRLVRIRQEARAALEQLPDSELTRFDFAVPDFERHLVDGHELELDGKMYDIARLLREQDCVSVWALHDEAEDDLLAFLATVVQRHRADKKTVPALIASVVFTLYELPIAVVLAPPLPVVVTATTPYAGLLTQCAGLPGTPPPRFL